MSALDNLTLITCSYNTPEIVETMLKSFRCQHGDLDHMNIVIMENSTDEHTCHFLKNNNITYVRNKGGTHSRSIDTAFKMCKTQYALVVDSDIVFLSSIGDVFKKIMDEQCVLTGIESGSRGGYTLKTRLVPWFMFVNVDKIKMNGIAFHDEKRINDTNSTGFYGNIPINNVRSVTPMYDVGATFYEDVISAGFKVQNIASLQSHFFHAEGMSWQRTCGVDVYEDRGNKVWQLYQKLITTFNAVDIRNFYRGPEVDT